MQDSVQSNSDGISITLYTAGNELEIRALFQKVFGSPKSAERWEWQFVANPFHAPQIALARDAGTGSLVGHYAVIPTPINWLGRPVKAGQSVDTMVDSHYRNVGIFERTAHTCYESLSKSQFAMLYGFPNRAALTGRLRNLQWERLFTLPSYNTRLSCYEFLKRVSPLPGLPTAGDLIYRVFCSLRLSWRINYARLRLRGLKFQHSNSIPFNYDRFWDVVKQSEIISIWKDRDYLTWRYDRCPDRRYEYFFLVDKDDEIAALCIVLVSDGQFVICELMAVNRNTRMAQYLLSLVTRAALRLRSNEIRFSGWSPDFFEEAFKNFDRQGNWNSIFCIYCPIEGALQHAARNSQNWTVTFGDTDGA